MDWTDLTLSALIFGMGACVGGLVAIAQLEVGYQAAVRVLDKTTRDLEVTNAKAKAQLAEIKQMNQNDRIVHNVMEWFVQTYQAVLTEQNQVKPGDFPAINDQLPDAPTQVIYRLMQKVDGQDAADEYLRKHELLKLL